GLGTASKKDIGTGAGQVPDMNNFARSLGVGGYQKLPGGLIIQWGSVVATPSGVSFTYPIAFPTAFYKFFPCMTNGNVLGTISAGSNNNTGGIVYTSLNTASVSWLAIGI
ncbi:gp53-like domain-containing protein, partial [Enterobacter kobei]